MKIFNIITMIILMPILVFTIGCSSEPTSTPESPKSSHKQIDSAIEVDGISMTYTISLPKNYSSQEPVPLVLALHYAGKTTPYYGKEFLTVFIEPALGDLNAIMVAPTCLIQTSWTNPICEKAVMAMLTKIMAEYKIDSKKIVVTGYSMGGAGTYYFAAKQPNVFSAAIPVSGMPQQDIISQLKDVPLYIIHSRVDAVFPFEEVQQLVLQLKSSGLTVEFKIVDWYAHYDLDGFIKPLAESIPWLQSIWKD